MAHTKIINEVKKLNILNPIEFVKAENTVGVSKWADVFRRAASTNGFWEIPALI